ncbi:hypothetical protein NE237_021513 [Protea cynaroides]|uniref:Uncharacterized protein n=1 Tax=Protea cynaroides TaxID=273540 RepID=A0A9Q0H8P0_9MAGN|nr:hypothetical protein NE237_021513 [Protea cynaroides]
MGFFGRAGIWIPSIWHGLQNRDNWANFGQLIGITDKPHHSMSLQLATDAAGLLFGGTRRKNKGSTKDSIVIRVDPKLALHLSKTPNRSLILCLGAQFGASGSH